MERKSLATNAKKQSYWKTPMEAFLTAVMRLDKALYGNDAWHADDSVRAAAERIRTAHPGRIILAAVGRRSDHAATVTTLVAGSLKYLAVIVAFVWGLSILGVNTTAVLAGIGIVGLILGFGAQSLIEDIITGAFIIFENQYSVGDIIILDDFRGTVRSIGVRTTVIEDAGGNLKVVNNSDIRNFQNRSRNNSVALVLVAVSYATDLRKLEKLLKEKLGDLQKEHPELYLSAPRYLGVDALADSGVNLKFAVDVKEQDVFAGQRMLARDLKILFDDNGVEIPFPQVVVHKWD